MQDIEAGDPVGIREVRIAQRQPRPVPTDPPAGTSGTKPWGKRERIERTQESAVDGSDWLSIRVALNNSSRWTASPNPIRALP